MLLLLASCLHTPSSPPEPSPSSDTTSSPPTGETQRGVSAESAKSLPSEALAEEGASTHPAHLDTALTYLGTWEDLGTNRGTDINRFLAVTGLGGGYPWCAAFIAYCLEAAQPQPERPATRSAGARHYINRHSIPITTAVRHNKTHNPGDILVWLRDNGPAGHAGFIISGQGGSFKTIEGNTSPNEDGDQRDGGVVALKNRQYSATARLKIHFITPVTYNNK